MAKDARPHAPLSWCLGPDRHARPGLNISSARSNTVSFQRPRHGAKDAWALQPSGWILKIAWELGTLAAPGRSSTGAKTALDPLYRNFFLANLDLENGSNCPKIRPPKMPWRCCRYWNFGNRPASYPS